MTSPHYARIAARLLGRAPRVAPPADATRARAIAHIELALAAKAQTRKRTRMFVAVAAAAAGLVGVAGYHLRAHQAAEPVKAGGAVVAILQPTGNGAQLFTQVGSEPLRDGSALPIGGRLIANQAGGAVLQLSTGTQIKVEQDANLTFSNAGPTERFELSAGTIHAHVAKLHPGERFIVATPDAEVEVRGTQFQLRIVAADPDCGAGTRTRLTVSEGIVEVRAQGQSTTLVHPGESWPTGCNQGSALAEASATAAPSNLPRAPGRAPRVASPLRPVPASTAVVTPPVVESSSLADQNDLFAAGMAARRSGDARTAIAKFQDLLQRYPNSALSESALAESMRAELTFDHGAAQQFARQYLQRYPDGFARHDAQAILAPP